MSSITQAVVSPIQTIDPMNEHADAIQHIETTCAYCGVGCGIKAQVDTDTQQVRVIGDAQHPANGGRLCSKGTALGETLGLSGRLLHPEVNGKQVGWDEALDTIAEQFNTIRKQHGPDALAFYLSGQLLTEDYYVANKLMKGFIGSANVDTNSRLCMSSSVAGHKRAFGTDTVPGCYDDFEQAQMITLVGSNTAWCHPVLFQRIKKYKLANPNLKVVVIDPRKTQTCEIADLHLPIKMGSDTRLFNGLLDYLAQHKHLNQDYISAHCDGLETALEAARISSGELAFLAENLGLSQKDLSTFFEWFAEIEHNITLYSQGVNQSASGTDKVNSILNCHLATGRIGKPGMGPFSMTGQPNAMGGREVGGLANTLAAHMDFEPDNQDRVKRFWGGEQIATAPGRMAVDMFEAIERGEIKAVWIMATNPVVSLPNADLVKRALEKCELVIVSDCVADTDTLRLANIKLPATGWAEKDGTVTNSERCISRQRALLPKAGEAQHDWWALTQVAQRMGFAEHFAYQTQADIFREHAALSGFENGEAEGERRRDFDISELATLSEQDYNNLSPFYWPRPSRPSQCSAIQEDQGKKRFFSNGNFFTANKKARFVPITPSEPVNDVSLRYPLRMNTGRIRDQWHTMTRTALAPKLNQHISEPFIQMHPDDAVALKLKDQSLVSATSRWGEMNARLTLSADVRRGDVFAPMHWTGVLSKHSRVNSAVNPEVDPVSKQPESKHTPVQVSAFEGKRYGLLMRRVDVEESVQDKHQREQAQSKIWQCADYAVSARGEAHQLIQFASKDDELDSKALLETLLENNAEGLQYLSYEDEHKQNYRGALLDSNGRLMAFAMIANESLSQDQTWLAKQFQEESMSTRARAALLSGFAPAGEDIGKIVCACFSVGEKTLGKAIAGGCRSTAEIGSQLKAGTNCGSCLPEIQEMISAYE